MTKENIQKWVKNGNDITIDAYQFSYGEVRKLASCAKLSGAKITIIGAEQAYEEFQLDVISSEGAGHLILPKIIADD